MESACKRPKFDALHWPSSLHQNEQRFKEGALASVSLGIRANRRQATALFLAVAAHILFIAILVWQRP